MTAKIFSNAYVSDVLRWDVRHHLWRASLLVAIPVRPPRTPQSLFMIRLMPISVHTWLNDWFLHTGRKILDCHLVNQASQNNVNFPNEHSLYGHKRNPKVTSGKMIQYGRWSLIFVQLLYNLVKVPPQTDKYPRIKMFQNVSYQYHWCMAKLHSSCPPNFPGAILLHFFRTDTWNLVILMKICTIF